MEWIYKVTNGLNYLDKVDRVDKRYVPQTGPFGIYDIHVVVGPSIKAVLVKSTPEIWPGMVRPHNDGSYQSTVLLNQQPQGLGVVQVRHWVNVEIVVAVKVL